MIYEINGYDITKLNRNNTFVITHSFDGSCILISSTIKPEDIEILNTINESELNNLLEQPFWKQPCVNCN